MKKLKLLERENSDYNDTTVLNKIIDIKQTLNQIYNSQAEKKAQFGKQNFYENRPTKKKIGARRIYKQQAEISI